LPISSVGITDIVPRGMIPWRSLFGTDDARLREEDIVNRRRAWTWRFILRVARTIFIVISILFASQWLRADDRSSVTWWGTAGSIFTKVGTLMSSQAFWMQIVVVGF